ncbi:MAG TPA: AMP-binding protein [Mycobacteriales bacterium]|nr:AMP-binding protein [Mycobacteriales bacterium]
MAQLLRRAAARAGQRTAIVSGDARPTWSELDAQVDAAAAGLRRRGLVPGDRVAIVLGNRLPFVVAWFAVLRAGLVAVPVNIAFTDREVAYQLRDCGARLVIVDEQRQPALASALAEAEQVIVPGDPDWHDLLQDAGTGDVPDPVGGEELAALVYTSGSSGRPRGAMLSHRALLANLSQLQQTAVPVMTPDDVTLLVLPLFHIYALNAGLGSVVVHAATAVLVERFDPVLSLEVIQTERVTTVVGAPPMYVAWSMLPQLQEGFASVRLAVSGSAPLAPEVFRRMREITGRPVYEGYGMTEASPVLTAAVVADEPIPLSVGRALPGVELRLQAHSGPGAPEPGPGEAGEVVVRGANLFSGYWPDRHGGPDPDGWFATGDIARIDTSGNVFLVDRLQDLILVSGFNVYPREVEAVLATHPDVAEVAVVGVSHPYTGEAVKAYVVPVEDAEPSAEELIDHAARSLARYKCPSSVQLVGSLPHVVKGKVAKGPLREEAR